MGSKSPIETQFDDNSVSPMRHATTTDKKIAGQKRKEILEVKYFSSNDSLILA